MITAVLATLLLTTPAAAQEPPQLSIAVDTTQGSATSGDRLTYTVTVRNLGSTGVSGLGVSQSVPAGLRFDSADQSGATADSGVLWKVDLAPAGEAVFHSTMTVVDTPPDQLRVATVACARTAADAPPVVCASHSAQLPAGAAAEAATHGDTRSWFARYRWFVAGGLGLVLVVGLVGWRLRRRAA